MKRQRWFVFLHDKCGQMLIELLVVFGILGILLPALLLGFSSSREGSSQLEKRVRAMGFMQEAQESVRSSRDSGWDNLPANGTYHPALVSGAWQLLPGSETLQNLTFTRQIIIGDALRDSSGALVGTGGTNDPSTKKITSQVSWTQPRTTTLSSVTYIARWDNISYEETTQASFSAGTVAGSAVTNNFGGEVTLGAGSYGDWCLPQNSIVNTLTLPKRGNTMLTKEGVAYIGTGDATPGITFEQLAISNPPALGTPSATVVGTYSGNYQTNAVFSDDTYAYLATNGTTAQVLILDLTQPPDFQLVGTISVPSNTNANGVYVVGNMAFVTSSNKLYTFDITTRAGSHTTPLGTATLIGAAGPGAIAKQVVVVNNRAYVGTGNAYVGLQAFNVLNGGTNLPLAAIQNITFGQTAQGLYVTPSGNRAYIAFNLGGSSFIRQGFYIIDTSRIISIFGLQIFPWIATYRIDGGMDPRGISVTSGNKAIIVGVGGTEQYQVVDISNERNPRRCGGLQVPTGVSGIGTVLESDGDVFSYIITGGAQDQFQIIRGGNGGQYALNGTYESKTFDATKSTAFNRLTATVDQPGTTSVKLQVGVGAAISGSCAGVTAFTYLGPGASPSAYFTTTTASIAAALPLGVVDPLYQNPGQCFRYKAFLSTTDPMQTPVLNDVIINYSP